MSQLDWIKLMEQKRRKDTYRAKQVEQHPAAVLLRTEFERDYDRILFSAPIRRLADKTQVFPLEKHDSVRTRLTHSHEVSTLARVLGFHLVEKNIIEYDNGRDVAALLAAIGLAHDLGNPPFGHQGEAAISSWFKDNLEILKPLTDIAHRNDFLRFEGNAQTFRILTKLQILNDDFGLDLAYGTLSALLKYPIPSHKVDMGGYKKHGFFQSERAIVEEVWLHTGLEEGRRHPLTYIMEACDDIAYSVIDVEDAVKKNLVSFNDLLGFLKRSVVDNAPNFSQEQISLVKKVMEQSEEKFKQYCALRLSPHELNDVAMQRFRVYAITEMVDATIRTFKDKYDAIMREQSFSGNIIMDSDAKMLCKELKRFALDNAYKHPSVLEVELRGHSIIRKLMDMFWSAIKDREDPNDFSSRKNTPLSNYVYRKISENYRRIFESSKDEKFPIRYRELQLLTDMISGMTDGFAMSLCHELEKYHER